MWMCVRRVWRVWRVRRVRRVRGMWGVWGVGRVRRGVLVHVRVLVLVLVVVHLRAQARGPHATHTPAHRARRRQEPAVQLAPQEIRARTTLKE